MLESVFFSGNAAIMTAKFVFHFPFTIQQNVSFSKTTREALSVKKQRNNETSRFGRKGGSDCNQCREDK